jgi:hypothetical protein
LHRAHFPIPIAGCSICIEIGAPKKRKKEQENMKNTEKKEKEKRK